MTALRCGSSIDVGRRRNNNEDAILVTDRLFAVADGMGGHAGGEVASTTAVEALRAAFGSMSPTPDALERAIRQADEAVMQRAETQPDLRNMGTTVTAVALVDLDGDEVLAVANVGDSRTYLLRDGELTQLTDDHSVPQELLRAGQLTEAEAASDPRRNQLTRVLGVGIGEPDVQTLVPYRGDRLLLCSDGLTNEVTDGEIASVLRRLEEPQEAADELVRLANEHGGSDNISVVVVDVIDDDDRAAVASSALAAERGGNQRGGERRGGLMSAEERNAQLRELAREDTGAQARGVTAPVGAWEEAGGGHEVEVPSRRVTVRAVAFVVAVLLLLGLAAATVGWFARGSYFVALDEGQVTIFKGRPGGMLWFDPTVEERTELTEAQLLAAQAEALEDGHEVPTLAEARSYVASLRDELEARRPGATTAPTTTAPATTSTTTATQTTAAPGP